MISKISLGVALFVLVAGVLAVANPASAWERQLAGTRTRSEIKQACSDAGGSYTDSKADKSYGCSKGGNYVVCKYGSNTCKGGGKGKDPIARGIDVGPGDVLGGSPTVKPEAPMPPRASPPADAPGQEPSAK